MVVSWWIEASLPSVMYCQERDWEGEHISIIPLSHYSKNVITYYAHEMLKFVVKSAGNFSFSQIWAHNTTDVRT